MTPADALNAIHASEADTLNKAGLSVPAAFKRGPDLFPELPETKRKTGPGSPCQNPNCGKPIPKEKRDDAAHCCDKCRREHATLNAIAAERERIRIFEFSTRDRALAWLGQNYNAEQYLVKQCKDAIEAGKKVTFRRYWENMKEMGYKVDDRCERFIKEYIRQTYPKIAPFIRMKNKKSTSSNPE